MRRIEMKTLPSMFARATLLVCCAVSTLAQTPFKPAEITFATDVQFPVRSVASGIVVVDVSVDSKGDVTGTEVQRDIASLTPVAMSSAQAWKYSPASVDGVPQASLMRVAFVFRPHAIMAAPPSFTPLQQQGDMAPDAKSGYIPPGIVAVTYPAYPIDAASVGAVVVQVKVNTDGKVEDVKAIRSFRPFTQFALNAAQKWQFRAATLQGEPVMSYIAIAFVYSPPVVSNY
jgi:TonB family protein